VLVRVLGWVCGVQIVAVLWVLSCTVLFSLFPFSIKLLTTYQKKKDILPTNSFSKSLICNMRHM
jgi:hypothetical protein